MINATAGENGNGDGGGKSAQVSQEKALAARAVSVIVVRGVRVGGAQIRMGMPHAGVTLMGAMVIRAAGRVLLLRMQQALGTGVEFGEGAAGASRIEQQREQAESDGHRPRHTPQSAQGL